MPSLLELPTDYPRPAVQQYQAASCSFVLGSTIAQRVADLCGAHGVSGGVVMLAAVSALAARYSGQCDVTVLSHIGDYRQPDHAAPLEYGVGGTLMRVIVEPRRSFLQHLQRCRSAARDALAHRDISIAAIAEHLGVPATQAHAPLAQIAISYGLSPSNFASREIGSTPLPDMHIAFDEGGIGSGQIDYDGRLFAADTIARLADHLKNLLTAACERPDARLDELPLMGEQERRQIVVEWNRTAAPVPYACVQELFEQQVRDRPDSIAVVLDDVSLTYAQLNAKANQLAGYLRARGVGPDVLVGLCVKRSVDMVVALLGILKAGGAYLPLDPAYPAERLAYMIEDAKPALILCQYALRDQLNFEGTVFCLDRDWADVDKYPTADLPTTATPQTLAYVIYTSGSTGKPKGVALAHYGLCNLCLTQAQAFEVDASSRVLQFASISFDAAVSEAFVTLTQGAQLHLIRQELLRSSIEIVKLLERSAITVVTLPPSLLAVLPHKPLPALKTLVLAGEAWPAELAKIWAPGRRMLNAYGPTESTVCATWALVDPAVKHVVPIGRPLPNLCVYIVDANLMPTPIGVPGELCIGGIGLARGYLGRPDLTAERFVPDPFSASDGARMYRTGDKARFLADGNIEFLGRLDQQVKLRGYRIELGEIEAALAAHDAITDAVVMVREDHPGERRLVAYLVTAMAPTVQELKAHLRKSLPDYMLPQNFVTLNSLPISPNGKVDRKALPAP